jgi:hypothetical protein
LRVRQPFGLRHKVGVYRFSAFLVRLFARWTMRPPRTDLRDPSRPEVLTALVQLHRKRPQ